MDDKIEKGNTVISVQNIYYMLSYAFKILQGQHYSNLATEDFHNAADLCAAILIKGIGVQIKRGLEHDYIIKSEPLSSLRGKLDITESIKTQTMNKRQMVCIYDDFSVNCEMNQIIKSAVLMLLKCDIAKCRKKELRNLMMYFSEVDEINLRLVNWNRRYHRNNATYRMLISICYLIYKGLLQTQQNGKIKLLEFNERRMHWLYEKFILEYYRKEHPEIKTNASQIPWQLDDGFDDMLPRMQSDIMLSKGSNILIIDAKYYKRLQLHFNSETIHSHNLYQIFTYVKNQEQALSGEPHSVSGMLLYAKPDESIELNQTYQMSGNRICVRTLDLNQPFSGIRAQLDDIANQFFGSGTK